MSDSEDLERRSRLEGFELEIFKLVQEHATARQWREWLRAPLEHAAANRKEELFTRLMDAGADGSAGWRGCHGRTLLGAAVCGKSEKMVLSLLNAGQKPDIDARFGERQETALHVAAQEGQGAIINVLLLAGADSNVLDTESERAPLGWAVRYGHHEVVNSLLLNGARVDVKSGGKGNTALHLAAMFGHAACATKLLQAGADKDMCNNDGRTPLRLAASNSHLGVAEELLAAGANPDILDQKGWSALHSAASHSSIDIVRALLQHGGDVMVRSGRKVTALHAAAGVGRSLDDNGEAVHVLIEAGAEVDEKFSSAGIAPLHLAVKRRNAYNSAVLALLQGGANVNALDASQRTPLHLACLHSSVGAVELLLRWGADETLVDVQQNTAVGAVGTWEQAAAAAGSDDEERKADDERIRHMIARAPADRCWRRRGWLVLCRYSQNKVQLTKGGSDDGSGSGSAKVAKPNCDSPAASGGGAGDGSCDFAALVKDVVGLDAEGVFRLVVSFL